MNSSEYLDLIQTDVLIIGTGIAGATVALGLADLDFDVTMVTRASAPEDNNTYRAQGGIIYNIDESSPEDLVTDIMRAGAGHSNLKAAQILAQEGPDLVKRILIERAGVPFVQTSKGTYATALEGGHGRPRIIHAADATGRAIESGLMSAVSAHPKIRLLTKHTAIDFLTPTHHARNRLAIYDQHACVGIYAFQQDQSKVIRIIAKKTVLASGGLGQIYLHSTNPSGARGDGLAMAERLGVRTINSEFVQFHPTAFYHQQSANFLISEAVRGAGARLVDHAGRPFMEKYSPDWRDLAPRDLVARSIHAEMLKHDLPCVFLDLKSYIEKDQIIKKFPNIHQHCLLFGIDITKDLVPVVPAAHYFCGGVWTDEWGQTTLPNLYAVGEVACTGLHGANRLASTSLLESLVWGDRASRHITSCIQATEPLADPDSISPWLDTGIEDADPALIQQDMTIIKHIMWNYVGLVRSATRLERALRDLRRLDFEVEQFYRRTRLSDALIGLRNAVKSALVVTNAAWHNKKSLGCHFREDSASE